LAKILGLGAVLANRRPLISALNSLPLEHREWSKADPTFLTIAFLKHPHKRRRSVARFAGNWKVGLLPALLVDSGFDGEVALTGHLV